MSTKKTFSFLVAFSIFMLMLSYAFVPLYNLFCKATGYLGSVDRVIYFPENIGSKVLNVRFNADVDPNLPWKFYPERNVMQVRTGTTNLVFFYVENTSDKEMEGIAVYNVTPHKLAKYFKKIACFCFDKQILPPKTKIVMPVSFFIDEKFDHDEELNYIDTITLSYAFFQY